MKIKLLKALRKEYKIVQDEHNWYILLEIKNRYVLDRSINFSCLFKIMFEDYFGRQYYNWIKDAKENRRRRFKTKQTTKNNLAYFEKLNKLKTIAP